MLLRATAMAAPIVSILLITSWADSAHAQRDPRLPSARPALLGQSARETTVKGRVAHVYAARVFTIAQGNDPELLVFAPDAEATPLEGSTLTARGALRRCEETDLETMGGCEQLTESSTAESLPVESSSDGEELGPRNLTPGEMPSRWLLVASSIVTATGHQLSRQAGRAAPARREDDELRTGAEGFPITIRPGTLGDHVDSLAGRPVRLPYARVVGVFDPRVFLIETQTRLLPLLGNRSRVLVFVEGGRLRVDPALLVASTVTVSGVGRTLLGMQVNHDVPWPSALTREAVQHLEIRAAILAKSVRTPEGVDLVLRSASGSTSINASSPDR
jgi:hypothetical protein